MSNSDVILLHKVINDQIISTIRDEKDTIGAKDVVIRTFISADYPIYNLKNYNTEKLTLTLPIYDTDESVTIEQISSRSSESETCIRLNFPTLIICQNCETHFPTKYQYQRHQCDFNAEKVVLKTNLKKTNDSESEDKIRYDCSVCSKQFANRANLERHQAGHVNINDNICNFCGKHFVSENRLRIHKENHCKKAGGISKFYRSDVTVWKCKKCFEIFSSVEIANRHVSICNEISEDNEHSDQEHMDEALSLSLHEPDEKTFPQIEDKNIEKVSTEILLQCEFCNKTYSDKKLLLIHQRKHTTDKNYECANCGGIFDSYSVASSHWLKKCSEQSNVFYLPKLTYCEYCDRTFKSHEFLYNHKIKKKHYTPKLHVGFGKESSENTNQNKAPESKEIINRLIEDVLKTLEVPVNRESQVNSFPVIEIKTEPDSEENNTTRTDQPGEKQKRGRKRKWFKDQPNGNEFKLGSNKGFKYQCERCIKVFDSIISLESHRSNEHVASFCCEECGQTLHSAKALLIHCRAHKSLKPYVCDTCGRSYSQTSHLWQHMRFHQGIKPFACPHDGCEARYTIRPDLKDHIRKVHTRERPFKCTVCNKCFLTGSVYYQHRLIHTNDRRYGCDVCQKRFFRADALNNHKRIHTDERPYPCTVCGREFRQKGDRNKHVRTQHPSFFSSNV